MSSAFEVAVLGAGGTIAGALVRDLAESAEVSGLVLLDLDASRAAAVAEEHGRVKARVVAVDARGERLAAALRGCRVLVNAASYRVNLEAMRAALAANCDYLDLGGLYWMTARQLELGPQFRRAGRLAVLGMGSSPGKTNVMAVRGARELNGEPVVEIHVAAAGRDPQPVDGLRAPYALRTLLDEVTMAPVVLDGGRPVELAPLAPGGISASPSRSARSRRSTRCIRSCGPSGRASAHSVRAFGCRCPTICSRASSSCAARPSARSRRPRRRPPRRRRTRSAHTSSRCARASAAYASAR